MASLGGTGLGIGVGGIGVLLESITYGLSKFPTERKWTTQLNRNIDRTELVSTILEEFAGPYYLYMIDVAKDELGRANAYEGLDSPGSFLRQSVAAANLFQFLGSEPGISVCSVFLSFLFCECKVPGTSAKSSASVAPESEEPSLPLITARNNGHNHYIDPRAKWTKSKGGTYVAVSSRWNSGYFTGKRLFSVVKLIDGPDKFIAIPLYVSNVQSGACNSAMKETRICVFGMSYKEIIAKTLAGSREFVVHILITEEEAMNATGKGIFEHYSDLANAIEKQKPQGPTTRAVMNQNFALGSFGLTTMAPTAIESQPFSLCPPGMIIQEVRRAGDGTEPSASAVKSSFYLYNPSKISYFKSFVKGADAIDVTADVVELLRTRPPGGDGGWFFDDTRATSWDIQTLRGNTEHSKRLKTHWKDNGVNLRAGKKKCSAQPDSEDVENSYGRLAPLTIKVNDKTFVQSTDVLLLHGRRANDVASYAVSRVAKAYCREQTNELRVPYGLVLFFAATVESGQTVADADVAEQMAVLLSGFLQALVVEDFQRNFSRYRMPDVVSLNLRIARNATDRQKQIRKDLAALSSYFHLNTGRRFQGLSAKIFMDEFRPSEIERLLNTTEENSKFMIEELNLMLTASTAFNSRGFSDLVAADPDDLVDGDGTFSRLFSLQLAAAQRECALNRSYRRRDQFEKRTNSESKLQDVSLTFFWRVFLKTTYTASSWFIMFN